MYIAGTVCVDALGGYPKTSTVCMRECDIRPCRLPMALISPRCDSRYPMYGNANTVGTGVTAAHDRGDTLSTPPVTKSTEALLLAATVGSRKCAGELGRSDLGISNQLFWRHAFRTQSDVASVESCRAEIDSRPAYPIFHVSRVRIMDMADPTQATFTVSVSPQRGGAALFVDLR
jgi:hypothetical protein